MATLRYIMLSALDVNSVWSIIARAFFWFGIATVIIASTANAKPERSMRQLKSNLGMFLMFTLLGSGLIYLLFGFSLG